MKKIAIVAIAIIICSIAYAQTVINAIPAPKNASGLCWDGAYLWCGAYGTQGDTIWKIDPTNGNVLKKFKWHSSSNADCYGLAFDTIGGGSLWVSSHYSSTDVGDSIFLIDTIMGARIRALHANKTYMAGLANDGQYLWHCCYYSPDGRAYHINKSTGAPFDSIDIPTIPQPWGATWDGQYLWVCNDSNYGGRNYAYKIDVVSKTIVDSLYSPGKRPYGLAWDGAYMWVLAGVTNKTIYQVDLGGAGTPDIQIAPTTYNYNNVMIDSTLSFSLTISNVGNDTLTVDTLFSQNPVFHYQSVTFPIIIAPTQSTGIDVYFTPSALEYYSSRLGIASDDPDEETVYVTLKGQGVYTDPTLSASATSNDFGSVRKDCVSDWFLRIVNQGYQVLTIDSIKYSDVRFFNGALTFPISLSCLETTYVQAITRPNSFGGYIGDMNIYSNSSPSPARISLSANGTLNNALGGDLLWEYDIPNRVRCVAQIADINNDGISDVAADADINGQKHLKTFWANSDNTGVVQWAVGDNSFTSGYGDECLNQGMDYNGDGVPDVLIGTAWGDRTVYAIDAKTGSIIWSYDTHLYDGEGGWVYSVKPMPDINGDGIGEVLAGVGGNRAPGDGPRSMYCFSGANGSIIWQFRAGDAIGTVDWIPDVNGDGIADAICGAWGNDLDRHVYCVSGASSGLITTYLWQYYCGGDVQSIITIPDINSDGKLDVVAGTWSDSVFGLSGANGQRLWATNIGSIVVKVTAIPDLIGPDQPGIAVACWGSVFNVLNCLNGNVYWSYATGSSTWSCASIRDLNGDGKNDVITGNQTPGVVYCFSGVDGSILWTYSVGKMIYSIRAINDVSFDGNQDVLVGTQVSGNVAKVMAICGGLFLDEYNIIASVEGSGTITPFGTVVVPAGQDTTFIITPNPGGQLDSLMVDGVSHGSDSTYYIFEAVDADHTISAMFSTTALPGWAQRESIITPHIDKTIKDGGALVGVPGSDKDASKLYAFLGTKTNKVRIYTVGTGWSDGDSMIFGHKYNTTTHIIDTVKFAKKYPGKGAALCFDNDHTIYATKGNGTCEFFAYDLTTDAGWTAKAYVPTLKGLKGGTSIRWFNGKVYLLAGGQKKDPTVDNFFVYTPEGDSDLGTPWTALGKLPLGPDTKNWKDGSSIVELGGTIYAIHGGAKTNLFYAYDWGTNEWLTKEEIPIDDSSYHKYKKKLLVKDGAASASGNGVIYATKGGGTEVFWKYTPLSDVGWERLERMPIEKADKKHAPKTGAAMSYVDGKVWLLVGNKQVDFWCYVPTAAKSEKRIANSVNNVIASSTQSNVAISNFSITPNPFSKLTTIRYTVPVSGKVSLKLYNTSGRLIETFLDDYRNSGSYSLEIRNSNLEIPQGIYFLKYEDRTNTSEIKLIVQ